MTQDLGYFEHVRSDIAPLLPSSAKRILEIGCGAGATLAWLKTRYPSSETVGVEGNLALKERLATNADTSLIADLHEGLPDLGNFDLILALDVLEHLTNGEAVLRRLREMLAEGGRMIISLPNVAHWSVAVPLLLFGRFDYADAGIMDRTHLRFFTEKTAREMIASAGLRTDRSLVVLHGAKSKFINLMTCGLVKRRLGKQVVLSAS